MFYGKYLRTNELKNVKKGEEKKHKIWDVMPKQMKGIIFYIIVNYL